MPRLRPVKPSARELRAKGTLMGEWSHYAGNIRPRNPDERRVLQMMFDPYLWGPEEEFAIVKDKIALVPAKKTKDMLLVTLDSAIHQGSDDSW